MASAQECEKCCDDNCGFFTTYNARKQVKIRSKPAGICYRLTQLGIFLYIVVYTIIGTGKHLLPKVINGSVRLTMQQPTQNCNPMKVSCKSDFLPMSFLPYCSQFAGKSEKEIPEAKFLVPWSEATQADAKKLNEVGMQHECHYKDNINLTFSVPVPGTLFLQTRSSRLPQHQQCQPSEANGWACDGSLFQMTSDKAKEDYFFADIERFTILIDHGFRILLPGFLWYPPKPLYGKASDYEGELVPDQRRKKKTRFVLPVETHGKDKDEEEDEDKYERAVPIGHHPDKKNPYPSVFQLGGLGTIISVADILRLANPKGTKLLDELREHDKSTLRWNGGVLHIMVSYENENHFAPLGNGKIIYKVAAQLLPQSEFKNMFGLAEGNGQRTVFDQHGLLIIASVHGSMHLFSASYLCQVLTTSVGILALASIVVEKLLTTVLTHKKQYETVLIQPACHFDAIPSNEMISQEGAVDKTKYSQLKLQQVDKVDPTLHASLLHELAISTEPGGRSWDEEEDRDKMIHIMLMFERRLNSLDGLDEDFLFGVNDKSHQKLKTLGSLGSAHAGSKDRVRKTTSLSARSERPGNC